MFWYVLFVQTGSEYKVEKFLKKQLSTYNSVPFIPLQEILFKKSGVVKKEISPLFPGYVFVESELCEKTFLKVISSTIKRMSNVVGLLKYSDTEIAMKENERQTLLKLFNSDYCIESSYGIIEGERIHIIDGPLKGFESTVRKVNRHKRLAQIEMEIMGDVRLISVALKVVEKVTKDDDKMLVS